MMCSASKNQSVLCLGNMKTIHFLCALIRGVRYSFHPTLQRQFMQPTLLYVIRPSYMRTGDRITTFFPSAFDSVSHSNTQHSVVSLQFHMDNKAIIRCCCCCELVVYLGHTQIQSHGQLENDFRHHLLHTLINKTHTPLTRFQNMYESSNCNHIFRRLCLEFYALTMQVRGKLLASRLNPI